MPVTKSSLERSRLFELYTVVLFFSYVLTGTEKGMNQTFGTTCHGAVSGCSSCIVQLYSQTCIKRPCIKRSPLLSGQL